MDSFYYFILNINQNKLNISFFAFDSKFYNKLAYHGLGYIFGIIFWNSSF